MNRVFAVVVNFGDTAPAIRCIKSLSCSATPVTKIVVVDNQATERSASDFARHCADATTIIPLTQNLGFAGGCNVGIQWSLTNGADYVLLVNSDAVLDETCLGHLLAAAEQGSVLGVVAPVILQAQNPNKVESWGLAVSGATGRMRQLGFNTCAESAPSTLVPMSAVSGCVMLIRGEIFSKVGLLDENYFFYFEDLDFCWRVRQAGWQIGTVGAARATHQGSVSIGRESAERVYYATRNHLHFAQRYLSRRYLAQQHLAGGMAVGSAVRTLIIAFLNLMYALRGSRARKGSALKSYMLGLWDFAHNRWGHSRWGSCARQTIHV